MFYRSLLRQLGHQKWLRFGVRDRIIRFFHNPDKTKSEIFKVPFFGKIYVGNFSTFLDWSVYYYGAYSGEELTLMREAISHVNKPVILDVGANIGHHSLFASTVAEEVHSFEPFPEVAQKIKEKIATNNIKNIKLHQVGLGDVNDKLPYAPPENNNTGTGSFTNVKGENILLLPIYVGDEYLNNQQVAKVDFIKMDIEGFEPQALTGLQSTINAQRPVVFFEWSADAKGYEKDPKEFFPLDYKIYDFCSERPFMMFLSKGGYSLNNYSSSDGNKLAVPVEKVEYFSGRIQH